MRKKINPRRDSLEFTLQKDGKRYLKLSETTLAFQVELPANYAPDNQFGHKMFESVEISINHEQISRKSTAMDYGMSENFFQKVNYDDSFILSSLDVNGTYDPLGLDSNDPRVGFRFKSGEKYYETKVHDGVTYEIPWYRWYIIMNINHGLAREQDVLPTDVTVNFRFQRAAAECAFLKIGEDLECIKTTDNSKHNLPVTYEESVIPLKNPLLNAYYAYSLDLETTMNKLKNTNLEIPFLGFLKTNYFLFNLFLDYNIRRQVLDTGVSSYQIDLSQGPAPVWIAFALSTLDRLGGEDETSMTRFTQDGLKSFDLIKDHDSVTGFPLQGLGLAAGSFYANYLKQTNR